MAQEETGRTPATEDLLGPGRDRQRDAGEGRDAAQDPGGGGRQPLYPGEATEGAGPPGGRSLAERQENDLADPGDSALGDSALGGSEGSAGATGAEGEGDTAAGAGSGTAADHVSGAGSGSAAGQSSGDGAADQGADGAAGREPDGEPLLEAGQAVRWRAEWTRIQGGFVDDPRASVREADTLVATVMQGLAGTFADRKQQLEGQWQAGDEVATEDLRLALRQYRSFFDRLLRT